MPKNVSVVVISYRRSSNLERILQAWITQTDDVWLCDCGLDFKADLPVKVVRFRPDPGSKARHAVALLTDGDYVIKADDDLLPKPGLVKDFIDNWDRSGGGILGLHGRKFNGEIYYKNTVVFKASRINKLAKVDFVGICTFTSRGNLVFDFKGCESPIEDLFWQMKTYPSVKKWVIPTKNFVDLPECLDKGCLFYNKQAREIRANFYKEYYLKNYKR